MKNKWRLFLFIGLMLLLMGSVVGCSESYTEEDLDAAYTEGRNTGIVRGRQAGYDEGYKVGYAEGKDAGLAELESELASTQQTLASTQTELASTKQALAKVQEELEDAEADLLLSNIKVSNLSIPSGYVEPGEKVTVSATVTNSGGIQISYPAILRINGSEAETKSVVLNAGESQVVSFTVAKESTGHYTVELGGLAGTFTVSEQVIEDLAYIKAVPGPYSDDADPEADGVDVSLSFYDSKSKRIAPSGVSVEVTVELYWYTNHPPIYQKRFILEYPIVENPVYSPWGAVGGSRRVARIPYDSVGEKPSGMTRGPILILTVNTPKQGIFEVQNTISRLFWP